MDVDFILDGRPGALAPADAGPIVQFNIPTGLSGEYVFELNRALFRDEFGNPISDKVLLAKYNVLGVEWTFAPSTGQGTT
jgi:hypothetical protein